ncbi:DUF333 domain-containing protein [Salmonella bongori]|uniref:DUF333 domain-containing protein n=4 Tax=Salmonella TaxID=590 RepID=A0A750KNY1_SALER|nr:DUF333 domain-containing protein [Salmonella bongori]EGE4660248.1 DUF333 domain-containing protein [Salmonella bongori serovar 48:i:- str. 94-0708]EGS1130575.1 DUF333 domain-containing protein [Salmonella bongori CFSAN000509]HAC6694835.1 DUF333 domain-containing protein [Salmonella bongori serovar 44:r:-]AGR58403.1 hypothetical protein A464_1217 [Salmonella bongori N268-08]AID24683.1 hypothetical protein N643_05325 [Salmonella bongori serovar 48:z41:-- str. RKS3044]
MKLTWIALPGVLLLGACSSSQHDVPRPPHIGMPNPAAVYCEQQGGTLVPVQTPQGVRSDCNLPNGEIVDEWTLWRRDHPNTKK